MYGETPLYRPLHWLPYMYSVKTGGSSTSAASAQRKLRKVSFSLVHLDQRLISVTAAPGQIRAPVASLIIPGEGFPLNENALVKGDLIVICTI